MPAICMQHQEFEPPEELRDTIKCFWYDRRDFGEQQSGFEVIPDGYAEIIFYFGSACSTVYHGDLLTLPSPFMVGLLNRPVIFYAQHRLEIIGVRCFPWTVFTLLGLPSGKDNVRIFEHPIVQLQSTLAEWMLAGKPEDALAQLIPYFLNARSGIDTGSMLFKAGAAMRAANGTMPVSQLATTAHATVRTLERKFKQFSGHSVKDVSGLMRFEQVRNHLWLYPNASLAGLAYELGYTDQAHLSREFKRYSGTTPAVFARKRKKNKLVLSDDLIAFTPA
ncbi:helix-turn-helix domain-containing protein [Spirosoma sp. SC4-14]|uniref:helix-turn-helix domain-containing protein n=1 Tax=Spirosoma sp. SC4-14 TaxID=3128900 RepID=UPI0030CFEAB4